MPPRRHFDGSQAIHAPVFAHVLGSAQLDQPSERPPKPPPPNGASSATTPVGLKNTKYARSAHTATAWMRGSARWRRVGGLRCVCCCWPSWGPAAAAAAECTLPDSRYLQQRRTFGGILRELGGGKVCMYVCTSTGRYGMHGYFVLEILKISASM